MAKTSFHAVFFFDLATVANSNARVAPFNGNGARASLIQSRITLCNFMRELIGFARIGCTECVTIAHLRPNAQTALEKPFRLRG